VKHCDDDYCPEHGDRPVSDGRVLALVLGLSVLATFFIAVGVVTTVRQVLAWLA
jgi:hypothetical protein